MQQSDEPPPKPEAVEIDALNDRQRTLLAATERLVRPIVESCAVVFCGPDRSTFVGSATLVRYRERLWLATAAHVIEHALKLREARIAWAPPGREADYQDVELVTVAEAWKPSSEGDIAAVLLKRSAESFFSSARPVGGEQLTRVQEPHAVPDLVWLVGSALAERERVRDERNLPEAQSLVSVATSVREACGADERHCDDQMEDYPRHPQRDFHVDWSRGSRGGEAYQDLFPAGGMSGSPLWSAAGQDSVWTAPCLRLLGVAWYWNAVTRCIRVVPMGLWFRPADDCLALVHEGSA